MTTRWFVALLRESGRVREWQSASENFGSALRFHRRTSQSSSRMNLVWGAQPLYYVASAIGETAMSGLNIPPALYRPRASITNSF
jgi:hypothetical protein